MVCANCKSDSTRVIITVNGEYCEHCSSIKATGGVQVSGILTRQSSRVRREQETTRADVVSPHKYDKASGKVIPNPDFVKLYPEHSRTYYSEQEVEQSGNTGLKDLWTHQELEKQAHEELLQEQDVTPPTTKRDTEKVENFVKEL